MSNAALNDMKYNFEPLILFQPKADYKVDEQELKKSIDKLLHPAFLLLIVYLHTPN